MKALSAARLGRLQDVQVDTLYDICVIQTATETKDALNARVATWADGNPQHCGLKMAGGQKYTPAGMIELTWDAELRLPKGTAISQANRIKILEMHGEPISEIVYRVLAVAEGPTGIVLKLSKVEPSV